MAWHDRPRSRVVHRRRHSHATALRSRPLTPGGHASQHKRNNFILCCATVSCLCIRGVPTFPRSFWAFANVREYLAFYIFLFFFLHFKFYAAILNVVVGGGWVERRGEGDGLSGFRLLSRGVARKMNSSQKANCIFSNIHICLPHDLTVNDTTINFLYVSILFQLTQLLKLINYLLTRTNILKLALMIIICNIKYLTKICNNDLAIPGTVLHYTNIGHGLREVWKEDY